MNWCPAGFLLLRAVFLQPIFYSELVSCPFLAPIEVRVEHRGSPDPPTHVKIVTLKM